VRALQSKKMLASTVQFSTYNRPPSGTAPANPTPAPRQPAAHRRAGGTRTPTAPTRDNQPHPPRALACTRPGGSAPSGPNSVPTTTSHPPPRSTRPRKGDAVLGAAPATGRTGQRSTLEHCHGHP